MTFLEFSIILMIATGVTTFLLWPEISTLGKEIRVAVYNRFEHTDEQGYRLTKFINHRGEVMIARTKSLSQEERAEYVRGRLGD